MPWALVTKIVLLIYLVLTCFSGFYRNDFMSLTAISLGIFAVECPSFFRRWIFRLLVAFIFLTFVFDIVHLIFLHDSREDDEADSGIAIGVRRFSYLFAWLSFLFRPVVIAVFWKDSLDYLSIIKCTEPEQNTVLDAMQKYGGAPM